MEESVRSLPPLTVLAEVNPYASFPMRVLAYLVDGAVISALTTLLLTRFQLSWLFVWIVSLIVYVSYFFFMTKLNEGQTLGKMLFKIQVVNQHFEPLSWRAAFFREVVGRYIQKVFYLLYLVPLLTPRKESIADLIAQTFVVKSEIMDEM